MHIDLVSTLPEDVSHPYLAHVASMFDELERRLGKSTDDRPTTLYLFRTQWEYEDLLRSLRISGAGSSGIFFHNTQDGTEGLATYTRGQGVNQVLATLQHEAFHCHAARVFPNGLPIWINEGLAQYFEDAVVLDDRFRLGLADTNRLALIQSEVDRVTLRDFLEVPDAGWLYGLQIDPGMVSLLYATAWAFVRFLSAPESPWRERFAGTLRDLRRGAEPEAATAWLNDATLVQVEQAWLAWLPQVAPHPTSLAIDRLITLARMLEWLRENNLLMPANVEQFRARMRVVGLEFILRTRGGSYVRRVRGDTPALFADPCSPMGESFEIVPAATPRTPPAIRSRFAPGRPTLTWTTGRPGETDWRIDFTADATPPVTAGSAKL